MEAAVVVMYGCGEDAPVNLPGQRETSGVTASVYEIHSA